MRIVFLGTPLFAATSLRVLVEQGYDVVGVVTATDKFGGRGGKQLLQSEVKKEALRLDLPILQPPNLKNAQFLEQLKAFHADIQVVVAFRMLPEAVWNMPPMGTLNVHASLLPAYRGAAPINWAIIQGEKETGVSTFLLKHDIDTGDLLMQRSIKIAEQDNAGTLHDKLMHLGAEVLIDTLKGLRSGEVKPIPQDDSKASHAPKLFKENCRIDFNQSTDAVYNFIRGLSPYPAAWTTMDDKMLKIYHATPSTHTGLKPGSLSIQDGKLLFGTADGSIECLEIQMEGRRKMNTGDFLRGYNVG